MPKNIDPKLDAQYRASEYVIHDGTDLIVTRIDEASPELAALFARLDARNGTVITAWNPHSRTRSDAENEEAQGLLETRLTHEGCRWLHAEGRSPDGAWREPSLCLLDVDDAEARALAVELEQTAIVRYGADGCGRLVYTAA